MTPADKPIRVQLKRTKGWRMPPNTVKVDRSTKFGNPFNAAAAIDFGFANKATVGLFLVDCFRGWVGGSESLWMGPQSEAARRPFADLSGLRGKNLACWCALDAPCHADALLELANSPEEPA